MDFLDGAVHNFEGKRGASDFEMENMQNPS